MALGAPRARFTTVWFRVTSGVAPIGDQSARPYIGGVEEQSDHMFSVKGNREFTVWWDNWMSRLHAPGGIVRSGDTAVQKNWVRQELQREFDSNQQCPPARGEDPSR